MIPNEDALADIFESLVRSELGVELGDRVRHDAAPDRLRVDFIYDLADPPAALEVTSIRWEDREAQESNTERLADELRDAAEHEGAGYWVLDVRSHRWKTKQRNAVRDWVIDCLGVAGDDDDVDIPGDMKAIGVRSLRRWSGDHNAVSVFDMSGTVGVTGFSGELLYACVSNASKLQEAKPRVTHLLVCVAHLMGSRDIDSTLVPPRIPETDGIDYVWILHQGDQRNDPRPIVWWAEPGQLDWNTVSLRVP